MNASKWFRCALLSAFCLLLATPGCSDRQETVAAPNLPAPGETPELATLAPDAAAFPPPEPGQIVFDLRYRGLDGSKEDLRYNSHYGYGGRNQDTPFIKDLHRQGITKLQHVHNSEFVGAELSALEIHRGKPVAYYLDLNADGKVTANERIQPIQGENDTETLFVTPDFAFINRYKKPVTFRALLTVRKYRGRDDLNTMWSPCCVLEGETVHEGQPTQVTLFSAGLSGAFDRFGSTSVTLHIGTGVPTKNGARSSLSRLIHLQDRFYQLDLRQADQNPYALRLILTPDRSATGTVKLQFEPTDRLKSELRWIRINGAGPDDDIFLSANTDKLPVGRYRVSRGSLIYGTEEDPKSWTLDFDKGPIFAMTADAETTVSLGQPKLGIQAVADNNRHQNKPTTQTTYQRGTQIYLTREVNGMAGEAYGRFETRRDPKASGYDYRSVMAQVSIRDPQGKQILSKDLEYG